MLKNVESSWHSAKLKDITTKIGSGATPRGGKESYKNEGITLIRSLNVYNFYLDCNGLAYIDDKQAKDLENVAVRSNDILLNITGASVARCCMVPEKLLPARVNQHVAIIRTNPFKAYSTFILYVINSPHYKDHLLALAQGGATREALTKDTIGNFEISLPPLSVQHTIANILSAYDNLIENNTRRIAILEEMAQMLYQEWFVKFRFPGHEHVKLVESEMGMIPEGWKAIKLQDMIELAYGRALKADQRRSGSIPVYGSSGIVGYHEESFVQGPGIIVGRKGNIGAIYWSENAFYPIDTVFYVKTQLPLYYVYYNLKGQRFINGDSAVPGLSRYQAYALDFLLPLDELLKDFGRFIEPIFKRLINLECHITNLRRTRDLILPRLISGEIDVSGWASIPPEEAAHELVTSVATSAYLYEPLPVSQSNVAEAQEEIEPMHKDTLVWHRLWE